MKQKLYQLLENAQIETKIAVEIQDWIIESIQESRDKTMIHLEENKLLPMHQEMQNRFADIDKSFVNLESKMDLRFSLIDEKIDLLRAEMNSKFDAVLNSNRLLAIPIVGATIGGLGVVVLEVLKSIR